MKRYLLFSVILLITFNIGKAEKVKHHATDSVKLLNFLKQNAVPHTGEEAGFTNAMLILESSYSADWDKDTEWISRINGITWVSSGQGLKIKKIALSSYYNNGMLSGTLDLSMCDSLIEVSAGNNKLKAANFSQCTKLINVTLSHNELTSANFTGCSKLTTVELNYNNLLPSSVTLPAVLPTTYRLEMAMQTIDNYGYSVEVVNGELYIVVDFNKEKTSIGGTNIFYGWPDYEPDSIRGTNVFLFKYKKLEMTESGMYILGNVFAESGKVNLSANVNIPINPGLVRADVTPIISNATALLYLKTKNSGVFLVDTLRYSDQLYISKPMPHGEYILSFNAPGYLFTYYAKDGVSVITDWKNSGVGVIPIENNDGRYINFKLTVKPAQTGNITISGQLQDASLLKAAARPFRTSTVLLHSSGTSKSTNAEWVLVATTKPDEETGAYSFTGLPPGNYRISVEIAGFESTPIEITASTSGNIYGNQNFVVDEKNKTVTADPPLSALSISDEIKLTVYPNPMTDIVRIDGLESAYAVKVINMLGQVVASETGTSPELTLNLVGKPSGMYLIRIESQGKTTTCKIIKK